MELKEYVVHFTSLLKHACEFAKEGVPSGSARHKDYQNSIVHYSKKWKDYNNTIKKIEKEDNWKYDERYALDTLKSFRREVKARYRQAGVLLRQSVALYGKESEAVFVAVTLFVFLAGRRRIVTKYLWGCRRLNRLRQKKGDPPLTPVEMLTKIDAKIHTFSIEFWPYATDSIARNLLQVGKSKSSPAPTILGGFLHDMLSRPDGRLAKVLIQASRAGQSDTYSTLVKELVSLTPILISESFYTLESRALKALMETSTVDDGGRPLFAERFIRAEEQRAIDPIRAVEEKIVFEQLSRYVPASGQKREYFDLICQQPHLVEHGGNADAARLLGWTENLVRQIRMQLFQLIRQNASLEK